MKKIIPAVLLLSVLMAQGCGAPPLLSVKVDRTKTIGLRQGQKLELRFDSNATTGYSWGMRYVEGESSLKQSSEPQYIVRSALIGAGGYELFRFEAAQKGTAKLEFEYRRPWEKGISPVRTYIVRVIIT